MARKLKFGSPAWRKKYMKAKRKPTKRKRATNRGSTRQEFMGQTRKVRKARKAGQVSKAAYYATKSHKAGARDRLYKSRHTNPPKMKRLKKSTGWMKASAVKIVKKGGQMQVLVRKPGRRKAR